MEAAVRPSDTALARTIAGLVALFTLAWIAGHPKLSRFESVLKVSPLVVTGIVFVFLGTLAAQPSIGILTGAVVAAIGPIVPLGLGWIGFRVGFDSDRKLLENTPPAPMVLMTIVFPLTLTVAGSALVIGLANAARLSDPTVWRDLLIGGVAIAMTSSVSIRTLARRRHDLLSAEKLAGLIELEQATGIFGSDVHRGLLPSLRRGRGLAIASDGLAVRHPRCGHGDGGHHLRTSAFRLKRPRFIVIVLGSICMSAGMASFLRLHDDVDAASLPVFVTFFSVAGATPHLNALQQLLGAVAIFAGIRAAGFLSGAWAGARIAGAPPHGTEICRRRDTAAGRDGPVAGRPVCPAVPQSRQ